MRKIKQNLIEVKVGRFNEKTTVVKVAPQATVADVLAEAEIELNNAESVWVEGEMAAMEDEVENGDHLAIIGKKDGGN
jgi:(p)ppGpp synthase/HD superfamily hydrolase